jgi:hypothetical protein
MARGIDLDIRALLVCYLNGDLTLADFEDWFVPVAWNIERTGNQRAVELAGEIELRLAEFSSGHWSEPDLRGMLAPLAGIYETELSPAVPDAPRAYSFRNSTLDLRECSLQL